MGAIHILVVIGLSGMVAAVLVIPLRKAPRNREALQSSLDLLAGSDRLAAGRSVRREWQGLLAALAAGLAAAALTWAAGAAYPRLHGLPSALSGGLGALAALLVLNLWPRVRWPEGGQRLRIAELESRSPLSFGKQRVFVLPLAWAVLLILALVLAGIYSATDENGLHRVLAHRSLTGWGVEGGQVVDVQYNISLAGPFPGWFYGVPLIAVTLLFISAVYWTLRRIARGPRPADPVLFSVDTALRSRRTRFVMVASSAALGVQTAGTGVMTGVTLLTANTERVPTADLNALPQTVPVDPGYTLALFLVFGSLAIAVAALVLLCRAVVSIAETAAAGRAAGQRIPPRRGGR